MKIKQYLSSSEPELQIDTRLPEPDEQDKNSNDRKLSNTKALEPELKKDTRLSEPNEQIETSNDKNLAAPKYMNVKMMLTI